MQLKNIASKIFLKIFTWLYRVRLTSSDHFAPRQKTFIHTVLCANKTRSRCLMMHYPNWLEEPVNFVYKERNYRRSLQKQPRDSKSYSLYPAKKHIATNQNVQKDHVIHGNSQGNLHWRKRKIYSIKTIN